MSQLLDLPLFPLNLVLYPGQRLPLHIYEPRYREMTLECLEHENPFGIILYEEGKMADVGCTADIRNVVQEYEDGRMDIIVEGSERFRVHEVRQERSYLTVDAETVTDADGETEDGLVQRAITQHMRLLELAGRTVRPNVYRGGTYVSFTIGPDAGLTLEQKQELLELRREDERILYLVRHFEDLIPIVERSEDMRRKISSNGHFQDLPPGIS